MGPLGVNILGRRGPNFWLVATNVPLFSLNPVSWPRAMHKGHQQGGRALSQPGPPSRFSRR